MYLGTITNALMPYILFIMNLKKFPVKVELFHAKKNILTVWYKNYKPSTIYQMHQDSRFNV